MTIKKDDILLDKYRIEKCRLGPGAYSNVYLATHLDLKVPRALKILRKGYDGGLGSQDFADYEQRFRLEAQLGAKLDHPNIVRVYDFEASTEQLVLVMEYCDGGSLAEVIEKARDEERLLSIEYVLKIAEQVASGLAELHKKQIVHRDLKPANILLDKNGTAKVADLGLAQVPGGPSMRSRLSASMPHPGTPGYMSPEQDKATGILTPASDIYAFGLVLFELLTGNVYGLLEPGTRLQDEREDAPEWMDELVDKMLAEEPKKRPWNGAKTLSALKESEGKEAALKEAEERAIDEAKWQATAAEAEKRRQAEEAQRKAEEQTRQKATEEERQHRAEEKARQEVREVEKKLNIFSQTEKKKHLKNEVWIMRGGIILAVLGIIAVVGIISAVINKVDNQNEQIARETLTTKETQLIIATQTAMETLTEIESEIFQGTQIIVETQNARETQTVIETQNVRETQIASVETIATKVSSKDGMVQVYVPAGEFEMGSNSGLTNEVPVHTVYLDAFWIDQTEVTNAMYALCVADGACDKPGGNLNEGAAYANKPIDDTSWYDAEDYCIWAGRELPTEAQWEKAARGTDGRNYPWGNSEPDCVHAHFEECYDGISSGPLSEVGSLPAGASPYGALDMAGNVWEWVADWYDADYYSVSPENNPENTYDSEKKVKRGGSISSSESDLRSASRDWYSPVFPGNYYITTGIRCAESAPE